MAFSFALLRFVWQGSVVAAGLWVVLRTLRSRSANLRYAICCSALILLAALPLATTWLLYQPPWTAIVTRGANEVSVPVLIATTQGEARRADWLALLEAWAVPIWSFGVLLFSARMVWGCRQVAVLRRTGHAVERSVLTRIEALSARMGVARPVKALISLFPNGPGVVGWLRPVILLPASALTGLTPQQLEAVLAHELAHIRRHDYLVNLLQMVIEALLFYHPAVWWVSSRIREEREFCCDDLAVRACRDAAAYARALSTLEHLCPSTPAPALASTGGPLLERIRRILGSPVREYGPSPLSAILAVSLSLACVLFGARVMHGQATASADGAVLVTGKNLQIVSQTPIDYPAAARAAGKEGLVVVSVEVDKGGNVVNAEIQRAEPQHYAPAELEDVALASVRKWRFAPVRPTETAPRTVVILFQADPKSVRAFMTAGDLLFRSGQIDDSLQKYEAGAKEHPERRIDFLKRQIEVYIRKGDQATALAKDEEILRIDPNDMEARGFRAATRLDAGHVDEALVDLNPVVKALPGNFVARFNLGRALLEKGDVEHAREQFTAALQLRPDLANVRAARARLELKERDYPAALQDTGELIRLHHGNEARGIIEQVLQQDPGNAEARAQQKLLGGGDKSGAGPQGALQQNHNSLAGRLDLAEYLGDSTLGQQVDGPFPAERRRPSS
jgi:TonB family protein